MAGGPPATVRSAPWQRPAHPDEDKWWAGLREAGLGPKMDIDYGHRLILVDRDRAGVMWCGDECSCPPERKLYSWCLVTHKVERVESPEEVACIIALRAVTRS